MPESFSELIAQLHDRKTTKRRIAAKRLGKTGDPSAGPALLDALERELEKHVTWEAQYQMAMALGNCGYRESRFRLRQLLHHEYFGTFVLSAIGYSLAILEQEHLNDPRPALGLMKGGYHHHVAEGAVIAVAVKQMAFEEPDIIEFLEIAGDMNSTMFSWIALACTSWKGEAVNDFLGRCDVSKHDFVRNAARYARAGKLRKYSLL